MVSLAIRHVFTYVAMQTACLLTYVTYFMAIHPNVAQEMRAEVLDHFGAHGTPTYESLRNLKFSQSHHAMLSLLTAHSILSIVRAVINETLRLFPPVPINVRASRPAACALPPPDTSFGMNSRELLYMPGNTSIMYFPLLTQRNPALWGANADEFDLTRWLQPDGPGRSITESMAFAPFSIGPRIVRRSVSYNSYLDLTELKMAVPRPELCVRGGVVLSRPAIATLRHVHVGDRGSASRFATSAGMEEPQRPAAD